MSRFFQSIVFIVCCLQGYCFANPGNDMDVTAGQQIYTQCTACHAPAYHRTAPRHCDILGRRAGSEVDFEFTQAMKDSNIIWTKKTLDTFLKAPLIMIPGTSMGFAGISSSRERKQLITFLSSLTEENTLCR